MAVATATIHVDGHPYTVPAGNNLLAACLSLGFDLPYFCWHPALGSVGACRQCAVKQFADAEDDKGQLVMACVTPAADGTRLAIADDEAERFRAGVVEFLMVNHPHDCPVCEEGGECHLQDMTHMTGHVYRRYRFRKRTHRNQDLGPFLNHEMNRCIACYRCVRFYGDYAGGRDLQALGAHDHVYFGRHADGTLESPFAGNLAEVCPTGVFTDKPFSRHYVRKWDLAGAPSVCPHCSLGCNIWPNAREGVLRRVLNRYNHAVNGYFLCDRGRYGPDFVNASDRLRTPDGLDTIGQAAALIAGKRVIGIGSPRASLEANYALRTLVGPERFQTPWPADEHARMDALRDLVSAPPAPIRSLAEVEQADAVLVLGEDATNTAPRLALALRQAGRNAAFKGARDKGVPVWNDTAVRDAGGGARSPVILATPYATALDDIATETVRAAPDDLARLGAAIAHALDDETPHVADLSDEMRATAARIAATLRAADRPLVVSGLGCASRAMLDAAANVAAALAKAGRDAGLFLAARAANDLGLALLAPKPLDVADADVAIVLESEPAALPETVIAVDHSPTATTGRAALVVAVASFAETDGTMVSAEGRAQRFFKLMPPRAGGCESWRWLRDLARALGRKEIAGWSRLDHVTSACANAIPALVQIVDAAPTADFRLVGEHVPRLPHRDSGRTALDADWTLHEPAPPDDPDSPLAFTMEGYGGAAPASLVPFAWAPGWNSVQALNKFQDEVGGPWRGDDPGVLLFDAVAREPACRGAVLPDVFRARDDAMLVLPRWDVFASEAQAVRAPAIAARAPGPEIALHPDDAATARLTVGDVAELRFESGAAIRAPIAHDLSLPRGVATFRFRGACPVDLPAFGRLARDGDAT